MTPQERAVPSVSVRTLVEDDAPYLIEVCSLPHCIGFLHAPTLAQVAAGLGDRSASSFVVESAGRRVGIIRLSWFGEPVWLVEVRLIAIAEPGKGFGGAAMAWARRHAFEVLGAHRMYLEVVTGNVPARSLYERSGFMLEGVWRDGFREDDGTYRDLAAYGMLDREYAAR